MEHVPPFLMDPEIPTDIQVDMTNGTAIKSYATTGFKYHIYIYMDLTITQSGLPKIKAPLHPMVHRRSGLKLQVFEAIYATCSD